MTTKIIKKTLENTSHPMETFLNIEPNTTQIVRVEQETELVETELYDEKDNEIEENFQEIYDKAMSGFDALQEEAEDVESKYIARINEVAIQYLNAGLNAASKKADLKQSKDKLQLAKTAANKGGANVTNNNLIVDTSSLIEHLRQLGAPPKQAEINSVEISSKDHVNAEFESINSGIEQLNTKSKKLE